MTDVNSYIDNLPRNQRSLILMLHEWILEYPRITSKIRYGIPFYYGKTWICYLNPIKEQGVELAFVRGNELSNVQGILDTKGRKQVAGLEMFNQEEVPFQTLNEVLTEALILDENVPYASKREKSG